MSRSQMIVSLIAVPLLVLLVACGGDKKEDSSSNAGGGAGSSTQGSAGGSNPGSAGGGSNSSNTSSNDGVLALENCKQYQALEAAADKAFSFGFGGSNARLDEKALNDLVKSSPSEIRGDMTLVVGALIEFFQAIEKLGVNLSDPASMARLDDAKMDQFEKASEKFEDKKVIDASERIEKYYISKCS